MAIILKRWRMHMKQRHLFLAVLIMLAALMIVQNAAADTYDVSRSFTDGLNTATLVGTLDIPEGDYTIMNKGASPFTAVNLTLTVDGTPFTLSNALTGVIIGNGQFIIHASAADLIFDTANADGSNPADLVFSDNLDPDANNRYSIGYNGAPGFEVAYTNAGAVIVDLDFPVVFGTAAPVPEPTTMLLLGSGLLGLWGARKKFKK